MAAYSFSRLAAFENCPHKYKLIYLDKVPRPEEKSIENFLGNRVHETLQKCYQDIQYARVNTLNELLAYYIRIWEENWQDSIYVVKEDLTPENYFELGKKMLTNYHQRYSPFNSDITMGTEMRMRFALDEDRKYMMSGIVDRVARASDDTIEIHDYKTSAHLPAQQDVDKDRQLGLYHIALQKMWPHARNIRLVWHYLAFDTEMVSYRTPEILTSLSDETMQLIDRIESAEDFPPHETALCNWCEYPDYCPLKKHAARVAELPSNEYLNEPGVQLVTKYAELKDKASAIKGEMELLREAIIEYARKEGLLAIKGCDCEAKLRFDQKLKFPGKHDKKRSELNNMLMQNNCWMEVSELDTRALAKALEQKTWNAGLIAEIMRFGETEESVTLHVTSSHGEEGEEI